MGLITGTVIIVGASLVSSVIILLQRRFLKAYRTRQNDNKNITNQTVAGCKATAAALLNRVRTKPLKIPSNGDAGPNGLKRIHSSSPPEPEVVCIRCDSSDRNAFSLTGSLTASLMSTGSTNSGRSTSCVRYRGNRIRRNRTMSAHGMPQDSVETKSRGRQTLRQSSAGFDSSRGVQYMTGAGNVPLVPMTSGLDSASNSCRSRPLGIGVISPTASSNEEMGGGESEGNDFKDARLAKYPDIGSRFLKDFSPDTIGGTRARSDRSRSVPVKSPQKDRNDSCRIQVANQKKLKDGDKVSDNHTDWPLEMTIIPKDVNANNIDHVDGWNSGKTQTGQTANKLFFRYDRSHNSLRINVIRVELVVGSSKKADADTEFARLLKATGNVADADIDGNGNEPILGQFEEDQKSWQQSYYISMELLPGEGRKVRTRSVKAKPINPTFEATKCILANYDEEFDFSDQDERQECLIHVQLIQSDRYHYENIVGEMTLQLMAEHCNKLLAAPFMYMENKSTHIQNPGQIKLCFGYNSEANNLSVTIQGFQAIQKDHYDDSYMSVSLFYGHRRLQRQSIPCADPNGAHLTFSLPPKPLPSRGKGGIQDDFNSKLGVEIVVMRVADKFTQPELMGSLFINGARISQILSDTNPGRRGWCAVDGNDFWR